MLFHWLKAKGIRLFFFSFCKLKKKKTFFNCHFDSEVWFKLTFLFLTWVLKGISCNFWSVKEGVKEFSGKVWWLNEEDLKGSSRSNMSCKVGILEKQGERGEKAIWATGCLPKDPNSNIGGCQKDTPPSESEFRNRNRNFSRIFLEF